MTNRLDQRLVVLKFSVTDTLITSCAAWCVTVDMVSQSEAAHGGRLQRPEKQSQAITHSDPLPTDCPTNRSVVDKDSRRKASLKIRGRSRVSERVASDGPRD